MPSPLVTQVRQLLAAREDEGRPISPPERALLLATLARYDRRPHALTAAGDVIDQAEAAIVNARRTCLTPNTPDTVRHAITDLLAATRALLDYDPPAHIEHPDTDHPTRPHRLDVDGYTDE